MCFKIWDVTYKQFEGGAAKCKICPLQLSTANQNKSKIVWRLASNVKRQLSTDFVNLATSTGLKRASCFRICKLTVGKLPRRLKICLSKAYFELEFEIILNRMIYGIVPNILFSRQSSSLIQEAHLIVIICSRMMAKQEKSSSNNLSLCIVIRFCWNRFN